MTAVLSLPARHRYVGTLDKTAAESLAAAIVAGVPVLIISGAYGPVLAEESIGWYDHRFSRRDWPCWLLEGMPRDRNGGARVQTVVGFCARSTDYANLFR